MQKLCEVSFASLASSLHSRSSCDLIYFPFTNGARLLYLLKETAEKACNKGENFSPVEV